MLFIYKYSVFGIRSEQVDGDNGQFKQGETQLGWSLGEFSEPGRESVISLAVQSTISGPSHFP